MKPYLSGHDGSKVLAVSYNRDSKIRKAGMAQINARRADTRSLDSAERVALFTFTVEFGIVPHAFAKFREPGQLSYRLACDVDRNQGDAYRAAEIGLDRLQILYVYEIFNSYKPDPSYPPIALFPRSGRAPYWRPPVAYSIIFYSNEL
jgi:hypothetical protein